MTESAPYTVVTFGGTVTDHAGNQYTLNTSGQIVLNGHELAETASAIGYANGVVWVETGHGLWSVYDPRTGFWSGATANAPFGPPGWSPSFTYLSGAVVNYQVGLPSYYMVTVAGDGGTVTLNFSHPSILTPAIAGVFRDVIGNMVMNITGSLANNGSILALSGIGSGLVTINLLNTVFTNNGVIESDAGVNNQSGTVKITGSGTFINGAPGHINLESGGNTTDMNLSGAFTNNGQIIVSSPYGAVHTMAASTFANNGYIEALSWITLRAASGALLNNAGATIISANSRGHVILGATHNAGQIIAQGAGADVDVAGTLTCSGTGAINVQSGATVTLDAAVSGSIVINSGVLQIDDINFISAGYGKTAPNQGVVTFTGATGAISLGYTGMTDTLVELGGPVGHNEMALNIMRKDIFPMSGPTPAGSIILAGNYTASMFHVSGGEILYNHG